MRRIVLSLTVGALAVAGVAVPLTASADPGEPPVNIQYSVDSSYHVTAYATGGKAGETFTVTVLPLQGGVSTAAPAAFLIEAVGNGGEIFDQVFDRFHRVVTCTSRITS